MEWECTMVKRVVGGRIGFRLAVFGSLFFGFCIAVYGAISPYTCVTQTGNVCDNLGQIQCQIQKGGSCVKCDGTTPLPNKTCVLVEAGSCNNTPVYVTCGPQYNGSCYYVNPPGLYNCGATVQNGTCTAVYECN
jgi:hypothetical protein